MVLVHQRAETRRLLHGVQVLPLEVLHQGQLHDLPVVGLDDQHRDLFEARHSGGPPAALPGDDLIVAVPGLPDRQGLDEPVLGDGVRQGLHGLGLKLLPGLEGVRLHPMQGHGGHPALLLGKIQIRVVQQGPEAPAQPGLFLHAYSS